VHGQRGSQASRLNKSGDGQRFNLKKRLRSFVYAGRGVRLMLVTQHNAWLHMIASAVVVTLGLTFRITSSEWCWVVTAIIAVWTAEALNTAFEFLCDVTSPEFHPLVERAKDVAAGAVLIAAVGATVVGLLVFGPYLLALL
jgi:diacylglycerol kinase (ATP)